MLKFLHPQAVDAYLQNPSQAFQKKRMQEIKKTLWILNDENASLSPCFDPAETVTLCDSHTAWEKLGSQGYTRMTPDFQCEKKSPIQPGMVLWKIPRSLEILKMQTRFLEQKLPAQTPIFAAGMVKHLSPKLRQWWLQQHWLVQVGPVIRKALGFQLQLPQSVLPASQPLWRPSSTQPTEVPSLTLKTFPGVFAAGKLDQGTAMLCKQLQPQTWQPDAQVADLGCGNGILGALCLQQNSSLIWHSIDLSWSALASAQATFESNKLQASQIHWHWQDGFQHLASERFDYVVSNPPFHQNTSLNRKLVLRLFDEVLRALKPQGVFYCVGNRGLRYYPALLQRFGQVEVMDQNHQYQVYRVRKGL